ncbi:MAG: CDP-alcohol phosphatidyltransferase family protein [Deltaproteobacteria bacterium]|nr:CDP-alcohol phosphatidyltransferase family protein [Deltaproteobacteria bacterium]
MSLLSQIVAVYRETRKPKDILWDRFVARPLASVLLLPLGKTRITPNQVTFLSLVVFVAAMALLALQPGHLWLIVAVVVLELSYVLDCVDGQLARLRHRSSPVGAHLDFLMDELKAFLLVAACGIRLWRRDGHELWLVEALLGLAVVACAISLTTFMRRPEYLTATGAPRPQAAGDYGEGFARQAVPARPTSVLGLLEDLGRFLIHYPSYILFLALADRLDVFLHVYLAVTAAYAGRSLLAVALKLGRS